ncbi:helix-turn-helix domain-containing protein [Emticicia sp. BO119]|uniref:helix-turn-helix domain-containing protein n=1 Tax=Emticicia sp. BO119 TaxID=2757768 RepID=UPI0015EFE3C9|nr:helix-turn-helix domain-containing protein [Emticicia sp. BO119]MBA4852402.1 helix-turn-helix domain-containing protein [Emticicia sp. BO119]
MAENQIQIAEYFQQTNERLDRIEQGLLSQKTVFTFEDFCKYCGFSKSWGYKLTSSRAVPHYSPNGKTLYFEKVEIDKWLLQNPIKTQKQLEKDALGGRNK